MQRSALLLAPLELLQTLHDRAVGKTLFMLDRRDTTMLEVLHLIMLLNFVPDTAWLAFVLS